MKVYVVQEEFQGIPVAPRVFRDKADADKMFIGLVNNNDKYVKDSPAESVVDAHLIITDVRNDFVMEDYLVRYWVVDIR